MADIISKPDFIVKGDQIAIISTARKILIEEIENAVTLLENWGLQPIIGTTIGLENNQFAGTDDERIIDFQQMLDNQQIKAIWCARGGYGTVRIIDQIDFSDFIQHPKWIIGYSDITVLHAHIHNLGISTIHGAMPVNIHQSSTEAIDSLKDTLFGRRIVYTIPTSDMNRLGNCTGKLVGGNLSILYSICGSVSSLDTRGKILCIEDLDEYIYHIDRMIQNLKRNGYFDQLSGLIVGGMTNMHDNTVPFGKNAREIIIDSVKEYDFPVVFDFPLGHISDNRAVVLGAEVSLEVTKNNVKLDYVVP
ncbi:LD-carboxypeptidase [Aquimarina addita]|uniref:LD-carboxypeptidase n=1 Tax=Aquimarina addita TaxID=870485 RepID=A0ABP7XDG8_9FLAO